MLERFISSAIKSKLGHLFEDFEENNTTFRLNVGAGSSSVVIRDLHFNRDVLRYIGVPVVGDVGDRESPDESDADDESFISCRSQLDDDDDPSVEGYGLDGPDEHRNGKPANTHSTSRNSPSIQVTHGSIGSLEINVPWSLLRRKAQRDVRAKGVMPCSVALSDVRVLLSADNGDDTGCVHEFKAPRQSNLRGTDSVDAGRKQKEEAVRALLELELLRLINASGHRNARSQKTDDSRLSKWAKGFLSRLLSTIEVQVKNIHVRFEDEGYGWFERNSSQYRPSFAVGLRLGSFAIKDRGDTRTNKGGASPLASLMRRQAVAEKLSVYWDSNNDDLFVGYKCPGEDDRAYYENRFEELDILDADDDDGAHFYLIRPSSVTLDFEVRGATSIEANLMIPSCHICFNRDTLQDAAYVRRSLSVYKERVLSFREKLMEKRIFEQLSSLRPSTSPLERPREWWLYACRAVRSIRANRRYFEGSSDVFCGAQGGNWSRKGWIGFTRLIALRRNYIALYGKLWESISIESTDAIHSDLQKIEDMMSEVEISAFRTAAFLRISSELANSGVSVDAFKIESTDSVVLSTSSQYRQAQLHQAVESINFVGLNSSHDDLESDKSGFSRSFAFTCQTFTIQANDTSHQNHRIGGLPISRLECCLSASIEATDTDRKLHSSIQSLIVLDLTSQSSIERLVCPQNQLAEERMLSLTSHNDGKEQAVILNVMPLKIVYSTIATEALSRLFGTIDTEEFYRDYVRLTARLSRWKARQGRRIINALSRKKRLNVAINIQSPVLCIPEDITRTDCPALTVDLGNFTFQSDSGSDRHLKSSSHKWHMQLENIGVTCQHTKQGEMHSVVEPFSLGFSLCTFVSDAPELPSRVEMNALMPRLCFNLTSSAVRLISRLQAKWRAAANSRPSDRLLTTKQTLEMIVDRRLSSKHLLLSSVEPHQTNAKSVQSREIRFAFAAPSIALEIANDVGENVISLVSISIEGIDGDYAAVTMSNGTTSTLKAQLHSIHARDVGKRGTRFEYLFSSTDPDLIDADGISTTGNEGDLVKVEVERQANGDSATKIDMNELYLNWNPELLAKTQISLRLPQDDRAGQTLCEDNTEFFDALDNDYPGSNEVTQAQTKAQTTAQAEAKFARRISFHLSKICVSFNKDSQRRALFGAEMNKTDILHRVSDLGSTIEATIADANFTDGEASDSGKTLYRNLIGLHSTSKSSIVMSLEKSPPHAHERDASDAEFHNVMKISFSEMKFVYIHQLWMEIFDYFFAGVIGHAVMGTMPKAALDKCVGMQTFRRTKFAITMDAPLLLLPVTYRSPEHIRLSLDALRLSNCFTSSSISQAAEASSIPNSTDWTQWFNNCTVDMEALDVRSWDERKLNVVQAGNSPPTMTVNLRWPVGPTAPLIKPKWNVSGAVGGPSSPLILRLTCIDFSLLRFFVSHNVLEPSRFQQTMSNDSSASEGSNLVLFGYEKVDVPPTTYSLQLASQNLQFQFIDTSLKDEGVSDIILSNASWTLSRGVDCISRQRATVQSIQLRQTNNCVDWSGYPDLLSPRTTSENENLLDYTSTSLPSGENAKGLHLNHAAIYLIIPAWREVSDFFKSQPACPEIFSLTEMPSIVQLGDRFYRMSKLSDSNSIATAEKQKHPSKDDTATAPAPTRQFRITLTNPQIIAVADSSARCSGSQSLTSKTSHIDFLWESKGGESRKSCFCDGLELYTGNGSNILLPVSFAASELTVQGDKTTHVWIEQVNVRASYTDLTEAIEVCEGVSKQSVTRNEQGAHSSTVNHSTDSSRSKTWEKLSTTVLGDGCNFIVTDDSRRHFASSQPLVSASLIGIRFSRTFDASQNTKCKTFASLDAMNLVDLLRPQDSPFRSLISSHGAQQTAAGLFAFSEEVHLESMSWEGYAIIPAEDGLLGYAVSASMEERIQSMAYLSEPSHFFDEYPGNNQPSVAFQSTTSNARQTIQFNMGKILAQYNPSLIIALQRFLGRLKKTTVMMLSNSRDPKTPSPPPNNGLTLRAQLKGLRMSLNKEHQERSLLDINVDGIGLQYNIHEDQSMTMEGSIIGLTALDPDFTREVSKRNRQIIGHDDTQSCQDGVFLVFKYETFKHEHAKGRSHLPKWIQQRIVCDKIDDFLALKIQPLVINHVGERTAELVDYLNNGLPGRTMGVTAKATKSFISDRIRKRSFLEISLQNRIVIPRSAAAHSGGFQINLLRGNIQSWFEESLAYIETGDEENELGIISPTLSLDSGSNDCNGADHPTDWWRILSLDLGVGMAIDLVNDEINGRQGTDSFTFDATLSVRTPSVGVTTVVTGTIDHLQLKLRYREFLMIHQTLSDNIKKPREKDWDNLESKYHNESSALPINDRLESMPPIYAKTARLIRYGETRSQGSHQRLGFSVKSISLTLHRDDLYCSSLQEDNASRLCYDICTVCASNLAIGFIKRPKGNTVASISLDDLSFEDVGDRGRMARGVYIGGNSAPGRAPCAFTVVAASYGSKDTNYPLLALTIRTTKDDHSVTKTVDVKVNQLSITLLPQSMEDASSFVSKKWYCPNSGLEDTHTKSVVNNELDKSKVTSGDQRTLRNDTLNIKFVAIHPRLILLADETNCFSRAVVLRGIAIGNLTKCSEDKKSAYPDELSTLSLTGHVKGLETHVYNNVQVLLKEKIGNSDEVGIPLIEPVTVSCEVLTASRTRFQTRRDVSVDIEPISTILSFSDLKLIEAVIRKWLNRKKKKNKKECHTHCPPKPEAEHLSPIAAQLNSHFHNQSENSEQDDLLPHRFEVTILMRTVGLALRKTGQCVIVESSTINPNIEPGDIVIAINRQNVSAMPLPSIARFVQDLPRPLTIAFERQMAPQEGAYQDEVGKALTSQSSSLDMMSFDLDSPTSEMKSIDADAPEKDITTRVRHLNLKCTGGRAIGIALCKGVGDFAVVEDVDLTLLSLSTEQGSVSEPAVPSLLEANLLPLPGAVLLAVDGVVASNFDETCKLIASLEACCTNPIVFTMSFVQADAEAWGHASRFDGKLAVNLTVLDDAGGSHMPVLRAGSQETSISIVHGPHTPTEYIKVQDSHLLDNREDVDRDRTTPAPILIANIQTVFNCDFFNPYINHWEPIVESHFLQATIERQPGNSAQAGQCCIVLRDQSTDKVDPTPNEFVCMNISDAAVDVLSKSAMNWRGLSQSKPSRNEPLSPQSPSSEKIPGSSNDLKKKANKIAKFALDFTRKRGKVSHASDSADAQFILRNRTGVRLKYSTQRKYSVIVEDGDEAQLQTSSLIDSSESGSKRKARIRQFPMIDVELDFKDQFNQDLEMDDISSSETIARLPTDRVGSTWHLVRIRKRDSFQVVSLQWTVELLENRRYLTLNSSTKISLPGCGMGVDVGVSNSSGSGEIQLIGSIDGHSKKELFLPIWVDACLAEACVYIRPISRPVLRHNWSTSPILTMEGKSDGMENYRHWKCPDLKLLQGVSCTSKEGDCPSLWMPCTFSDGTPGSTTVSIWSAVTLRNLLPCQVEYEVAREENGAEFTFDSSFLRRKHQSVSTDHGGVELRCGSAVEVYSPCSLVRELKARFKCRGCDWSEEVTIDLESSQTAYTSVRCSVPSSFTPLVFGVKVSPRCIEQDIENNIGVNVLLYAEVWIQNLTSSPFTFGAPVAQAGSTHGDIGDETSQISISADSALLEMTSLLEEGFDLLGSAVTGVDEGLNDDVVALPVQQNDEYVDEVFEYAKLNGQGVPVKTWWAAENHVSLRPKPDTSSDDWSIDCAGWPFLEDGWESCANIAGSRSYSFNSGRRSFNKMHYFQRRRWVRSVKSFSADGIAFHHPVDVDRDTRVKQEAARNAVGSQLDNQKADNTPNLLDVFNQKDKGLLDVLTKVANDGSLLLYVKLHDGKWSSPAVIPASGRCNGVIQCSRSRWPAVTESINSQTLNAGWSTTNGSLDDKKLCMAPLESEVYELIYNATLLDGPWGELTRLITFLPRFIIRNESSIELNIKQSGSPDASCLLVKAGNSLPFYWHNGGLPELVAIRPSQTKNYHWSNGFDLCTLGMLPVRIRRSELRDGRSHLSMRVNVELTSGTGGSGTTVSIGEEDSSGEGSLFRIENHSPFEVYVGQDGVLANPSSHQQDDERDSFDSIRPGECLPYSLDVPWMQGKYENRASASIGELLLLRVALAPLSTREGVESTKVVCLARVGDLVRLSPSRLTSIGSFISSELLGVRVLGVVGTDGPTRTLRFCLMKKDVTSTSLIGKAVREIGPIPSFMSAGDDDGGSDVKDTRTKLLLVAAAEASQLLNTGKLPNEHDATRQAFFGTGQCSRPQSKPLLSSSSKRDEADDQVLLQVSLSGFVVSLIDSVPTELAVISCHGVNFEAEWDTRGESYSSCSLATKWFQIDNHCPASFYPVALCPRVTEGKENIELKPFTADKPFLQAKIEFAPRHRSGIQVISAGAQIHDVELFVDLAFIIRCQTFFLTAMDHILMTIGTLKVYSDDLEQWDMPKLNTTARYLNRRTGKALHFKRLTILPCKIKLSVAPNLALSKAQEEFEGPDASAIHAAVRKGDLLIGNGTGIGVKLGSKNKTLGLVVQGMFKSVLVDAILRCDGASLNLQGVGLYNYTSTSRAQLKTYLGAHYLASFIGNVPALIGSLSAVGNPLGLMRNLGDGVSDFVSEPVRGFKQGIEEMNPGLFAEGLARGTGSLARHTVGGFADSVALLAQTAASNMAVLTLDRKYAQKRDRIMRLKRKEKETTNVLDSLESGVQKLINGVLEGVTGVVVKPIKGAERSGLEGFFKGVGKGELFQMRFFILSKHLNIYAMNPNKRFAWTSREGTTDLLTEALIGVKNSVNVDGGLVLVPVRPRRALYGDERLMKSYKLEDAIASAASQQHVIRGEDYLTHLDMTDRVALFSVRRLLVLSSSGEELLLLSYESMNNIKVATVESTYIVKIYCDENVLEEMSFDEEKTAITLAAKISEALYYAKKKRACI